MATPSPKFPLTHPALKRYYWLTEHHITDKDWEDIEAKTLTYMAIINRGLSLREEVEKKEEGLEK